MDIPKAEDLPETSAFADPADHPEVGAATAPVEPPASVALPEEEEKKGS